VKIDVNQIPFEGITLKEEVDPKELDLETDLIKFRGPLKIRADISKIINAVTVHLALDAVLFTNCSRCLQELEIDFKKKTDLNYQADKSAPVIDFNPDIREEVILDYSMKPLCKPDCKGLCPKCGKNLNEGGCSCGST
jgi:uncharacterized protein